MSVPGLFVGVCSWAVSAGLSVANVKVWRGFAVSLLLIGVSPSFAATYYVCNSVATCNANGGSGWSGAPSDSNDGTSKATAMLTITGGVGKLSGGDTLIIGNGTYTQKILNPPSGSSSAYTTVKAENDWGVLIDGSGWTDGYNDGIHVGGESYVLVRGFRVKMNQSNGTNQAVNVPYSDHVKLIRIGAWNGPVDGNAATFTVGPSSSFVLVEECYAFGGSRYEFLVYWGDSVIVRRSVARNDYWTGVLQCAGFTNYSSIRTVWENNVAIDSDTANCSGGYYGGFFSENKSDDPHGGDTTQYLYGDIIFNIKNSIYSDGDTDTRMSGTRVIRDMILWNATNGYAGAQAGYGGVASNLSMSNLTMGHTTASYDPGDGLFAGGTGVSLGSITNSVTNSLFWQNHSYGIAGSVTSDYNAFYGNGAPAGGSPAPAIGTHSITTTNPAAGSVMYLPRVEAGSTLATAGSGGGRIGAQILYQTGVSGTLYGEPGYDALTSTSMWPFPNEAQIKSDMAAYSGAGAAGALGFAAAGNGLYGGPITLTSYIWEALGNACPGDCQTQSSFLPGGSSSTNYALTVSAPIGGTVSGTNCTSGTFASGTNVSCTATPSSGYAFAGWSGACSGTGACSFALSANSTVTASFIASSASGTSYILAVSNAGGGSGTITGTNCTSGTFASGTNVSCTATPRSGSTFAGWSGACSGTGACSFALSGNSTVTATFNASSASGTSYSLAVSNAGGGNGTITGTNCTSGTYASGINVSCTATPGSGSTFAGWSGACSGTGACSFVLSANSAVTAAFNASTSAGGLWTWMGGSNTVPATNQGRPGVYNALGTPAAGSVPGSRTAPAGWTDSSGNLWLFAGGGFDSAGVNGYLNDLWEYIPSTEQWIWMGGRSTLPAANQGWPGVYGNQGVPSPDNSPGSREASVTWTDKSGNLWLFGGIGYDSAGNQGSLNDLWKLNPSTKEWTWIGGSSTVQSGQGQPGVYGRIGVADASNIPGGRWGASSWTDNGGNFWLFGGSGYDSVGALGSLNDLWELDAATNRWTWIGGNNTVGSRGGQPGAYGSIGNPSTANVPSGRNQAVSWADDSGNFWILGGRGFDSKGTLGYLNDIWEFNPSTREWTWIGGSNVVSCTGCGMPGVYGTQGQADTVNIPGGRNQAIGWSDKNGNFWLLGGNGYDSAATFGTLNDLWEFLPSTREWAWMGGSSTLPAANRGLPGVYGQLGVPANGNTPGGRWGGSGWTDSNDNLWLLGGSGYDASNTDGTLNDLWVYQLAPGNLPAATPVLSLVSGSYNAVQRVTITDATPGSTIYYTTDGTLPSTASSLYNGPITVSSNTTIEAIASAKNYKTSAVASATYTISPDFSLSSAAGSATNISVQQGGMAKYDLMVTPVGSSTLVSAVTLTATGLPIGATATFSPTNVSAGQGATHISLSVQTSTNRASSVPADSKWTFALCLLFFPLIGLRRLRAFGNHVSPCIQLVGGMLLLAGATLAMNGCGGAIAINKQSAGTQIPYTVTITAVSAQTQRTTSVTMMVQ